MKHLLGFVLVLLFFACNSKSKEPLSETKDKHFANELINETSPYLLQHAYNPVQWKAWNTKSLEQAKKENKLIIISVGYSSCHWCHVMEEESFENDSVAKLMNENFINIKVDREERPDVDKIYMNAVQLMTGGGGWPLNCITLPDGRPIFGGTYFTKEQWIKVLEEVSNLYKNTPEKAIEYAEHLTQGIKQSELIKLDNKAVIKDSEIDTSVKVWRAQLDFKDGGQGEHNKFPMVANLDFLLRYSFQNKNEELQTYVNTSLTKMAYGGIYDQVGGGFSRYAVDTRWHIPHFEKMLYDNAQLVSLYSKAYTLTRNQQYKTVIDETLNFIAKELTTKDGAFYSSLDADSKTKTGELEEGAFYIWTEEELKQLITKEYSLFKEYYNINDFGLWENSHFVLVKNQSDTNFATKHKISLEDLQLKVKEWKKVLLEARNKRSYPRLDNKVLTSWNALMLKGYVEAYKALKNPSYLEAAIKNAEFIMSKQLRPDGGLYHSYKDGKSTINAYSEDYATVIQSFVALYEVTLDEQWLKTSKALLDYIITHFFDAESGMFYFTSDEDADLITRKMEVVDNAIPSSNSILADCLFQLSHHYSNSDYANKAEQMVKNMVSNATNAPSGFANWLNVMLNYTKPYYEVAISGEDAIDKVEELTQNYLPNILISGATSESNLPLMKNRFNDDDTYIYVCVNGTCRLPVLEVEKAISLLK